MSSVNYSLDKYPYYDTSESEMNKGYVSVLFTDGARLQNRELNASQGLMRGVLRKLVESTKFIEEGSIISGCSFTNNQSTKICTLSSGQIYLHGIVVDTPETKWSYSEDEDIESEISSGSIIVYADVLPTIITASDDNTLYNPAENYESFGDSGAHRLKYVTKIYAATPEEYNEAIQSNRNIVPLIKVYNRQSIGTYKENGLYGGIYREMAQRTFDQSGDFVATGLKVTSEKSQNNPDETYKVCVSAGRCYVQGWQYKFATSYIICDNNSINIDSTLTNNIAESILFKGLDNLYYLSHKYVKDVINITAPVVTQYDISVSDDGTIYIDLSQSGVSNILGVTDIVFTYEENSEKKSVTLVNKKNRTSEAYDYELTSNTRIQFNTSNPVTERVRTLSTSDKMSPYVVHKDVLSVNTDYVVTYDKTGGYIKFDNSLFLAEDYYFDVNYSWYMPRIDLVYISASGLLSVKAGTATDTQSLKNPDTPLNALPLAYITVLPRTDANTYDINEYGLYRLPIGELQNLKKRIDTLEYNVTMSKLEEQLANSHTEQDNEGYYTLKNIYADSVTDYTKCDLNSDYFNATVDIFRNEITLPMTISQIGYDKVKFIDNDGTVLDGGLQTCYRVKNGTLLTTNVTNSSSSYVELISVHQDYSTSKIDLTPYFFKGLTPSISAEPVNLSYVEDDEDTIVVWMPNRVIYSSSYVDTLVDTVKNYTGTTIVTYNTTTDNTEYGSYAEYYKAKTGKDLYGGD